MVNIWTPIDTIAAFLQLVDCFISGHPLEGPVWDRRNSYLLFSDVKANAIQCWERNRGVRLELRAEGSAVSERYDGMHGMQKGWALCYNA